MTDIIRAEFYLKYNSAAYTSAAGKDLSLEYTSGEQIHSFASAGFLDQASEQRKLVKPYDEVPVSDAGVQLKLTSGEVLTGDSDLLVRVFCRNIILLK